MTTFVDRIDAAAAARLLAANVIRRWPAGSVLFHEGDKADRVLLLRSGHVKLIATEANGTQLLVALRRPGELVGELSAMDGLPRSASAIAADDVECDVVGAEEFRAAMAAEPSIAVALVHVLAARLRETDGRRMEQHALGADKRLARRLVELAGETMSVEGLNQDDLARLIGASRESVAKSLQIWRAAGLVRTGRRRVDILDKDGLERRAT